MLRTTHSRLFTGTAGLVTVCLAISWPFADRADAQQAINSFSGVTLFFEGSIARSRLLLVRKGGLRRDGEQVADPADRNVSVTAVPFIFNYGLHRHLALGLVVPYVAEKRLRFTEDGQRQTLSSSGLGDLLIGGKWRVLKVDAYRRTTQAALILNVKLPTGSGDTRSGAELLSPSLQVGTGSVDYLLAFGATQIVGRGALHVSAGYRLNTEGGQDYAFGDAFSYNIVTNYRVWHTPFPGPELGVGVELNGEVTRKDSRQGTALDNTGGHTVFISPDLFFVARPNLSLEFSIQIPMFQNLNGSQLGTDFRAVAGIRYQYSWL